MSLSGQEDRRPSELVEADFERLRIVRATEPQTVAVVLQNRRRRPLIAGDQRLLIVAADHPARGSLAVRDESMAMANRYDLLQRLTIALNRPGVDGVLGTPDILEDLAILGALEGKIAVGSMNRGGLRGAAFEMDDRFTSYDIGSIVQSNLDFAKLLLRVNLEDAGTARTLEECARMVTKAARAQLPIMIEPFMSARVDGRIRNDLSTDSVMTSVAIASGIGSTSAFTWLKLPVVAEMERVMEATTLPTLLLGGEPPINLDETYSSWEHALSLPGVHGLVVGRTLLYPVGDDVAGVVDTASQIVHGS